MKYRQKYLAIPALIWTAALSAIQLEWEDTAKTRYKSNTYFSQRIFINKKLRAAAEGRNKNVLTVLANSEGKATIAGSYYVYERYHNEKIFKLTKVEHNTFQRTRFGRDIVPETNLYPVVRSAVMFPEKDIKAGESWSYQGQECQPSLVGTRHQPHRWTLHFKNTLLGETHYKGKKMFKVAITYTVSQRLPPIQARVYPISVRGEMKGFYLWDPAEKYAPYFRTSGYYIFLFTKNPVYRSHTYQFTKVETFTEKIKPVKDHQHDRIKKEVTQKLRDKKVDLKVRQGKKGVIIELENILFDHNSALLTETAKSVLGHIAPILKTYKNDLRVEGHTDNTGSPAHNLKLSEERAKTVTRILTDAGVDHRRLAYKGLGESRPIAPNTTKEGRAKNRRVEIIILNE